MADINLDITGKITSIDVEKGRIFLEILENKTGKKHKIDSLPEEIYRRVGTDGNYLLDNEVHYREKRFSGSLSDRAYVSGEWIIKVLSGQLRGRLYTHSFSENFRTDD